MESILKLLILSVLFTSPSPAQTPSVIPLSSEPHHHLVFHNQYVNIYYVEVAPHNAVLLHRHDFDAISIMLDDAEVTVHATGKPDVHQNLSVAQVRLQPRGYAHSTAIDGDKTYRNITVELLLQQQGESNLCSVVVGGQPLHCPAPQGNQHESAWIKQPQFETDRTRVSVVRVKAHQEMTLSDPTGNLLVIAIDGAEVDSEVDKSHVRALRGGNYIWLAKASSDRVVKNATDKEVRIVTFNLKG